MYTYHDLDAFDKAASGQTPRQICQGIMDRIREEEPAFWPYGCSVDQHDGGVFLIRKKANQEPVGFVGWQERLDPDFRKVGYYSIGVLPEYRRQGFAKKAVTEILKEKVSRVHRVRALIRVDNNPSKALAKNLGVQVEPFV
jgi:RimJ/RimL family protein N-acetyltransferase